MDYYYGSMWGRIAALNPDDVKACNELGLNLLHVASLKGRVKEVKESLKDTDVNSRNESRNWTALHFAAFKGHVEIVKLLLAEGADVNVKSIDGATPLHLAHCHLIAKELVDNGADVNVADEEGITPLHSAATTGNLNVVRFLIRVGSDIDRKNMCGYTALHVVAVKDYIDIVKLLLAEGADVNVKSSNGSTPLHLTHCHFIAKELVDNGADVNVVDEDGSTPLHFAAYKENLNVVRFLISVGVDIDVENEGGFTALGYAVLRRHINTVQLLLTSGADNYNYCAWNLLQYVIVCKKNQMLRSIIEYKQRRLESPLIYWNQFHSVEPRYIVDFLDFVMMDTNASVMDLFKSFSSLVNNGLLSIHDDLDVFRRLLDYDCDYNIRIVDSYEKSICLKHYVRLSVVKPDDRFCLEKCAIRFNGTKEKVESLKLECRREIEVLKEMKIGDSLFTMHDILVGNTVLAFRCVSGVGVKVIQEMDFEKTPIYGGMVLCKLKRVFRRVNLINQLKNECTEPAALLNLPDVPFDVIVKFLSDDDLEMLVKVSCARVPLSCSLGDEFWNS